MFIYAFGLPVIEQLSSITVQWLENLKGKLMVDAQTIQNKINDMAEEEEAKSQVTNVIGFALPEEVDYEEDYDEDDE